jgi:uncharacterized protein (DUF1778 family)
MLTFNDFIAEIESEAPAQGPQGVAEPRAFRLHFSLVRLAHRAALPYTCTDMAVTKSDRLEARLTPTERKRIEQAAALAGEPVSAFVVLAALDRAEIVVTERASTVVPADYFDRLVSSLDEPGKAPRLARAARRAQDRKRIKAA